MNKMWLAWFVTLMLSASLRAQGFINLDFESAKVIYTTNSFGWGGFVATSNALPGWSLFDGTNQLAVIQYNQPAAGPPQLLGTNKYAIAGNFDVLLGGGPSISINQTGLVPNDARSLIFDAFLLSHSPLLVSLGGQNLSYSVISSATNTYGLSYSVCAADISNLAGQVKTLAFSGGWVVDSIQFSPTSVPEPSVLSLILIGSSLLLFARARRHGAFTHPIRRGLARVK